MRKLMLLSALVLMSCLSFASDKPDHSIWDRLLNEYVNSKGFVDYKGMKVQMDTLDNYLKQLIEHSPQSDWSKNEKKAYYINAYNAYCIKFVLTKYPVASVNDINFSGKEIWDFKMVHLGDKTVTLRYLENDILRKMGDPRIHFAINCASYSCPKLANKAYTASNVNSMMDKMAKVFINDASKNEITAKKVRLSMIFDWYKDDFIKDGQTLIDFLNKYADVPINANAKVEYLEYNWALNKQ